jgi:hypothetical protein
MKNILFIVIIFIALSTKSYSQKIADKNATKETVQLYKKMLSLVDKGIPTSSCLIERIS